MTRGQLLILALFLLVLLLNLAGDAIRRMRQREARERQRRIPSAREPAPGSTEPIRAPVRARRVVTTAVAPERRATAPRTPAPGAQPVVVAPPIRRRARGRLGTPRELRRAVVAMTVLGPCRGVDPAP